MIIENKTPGPGQYDPRVNITMDGKYFVSTYRNSIVRKFGSVSTHPFSREQSMKHSMDGVSFNDVGKNNRSSYM